MLWSCWFRSDDSQRPDRLGFSPKFPVVLLLGVATSHHARRSLRVKVLQKVDASTA